MAKVLLQIPVEFENTFEKLFISSPEHLLAKLRRIAFIKIKII
jgi:hypothetical protein